MLIIIIPVTTKQCLEEKDILEKKINVDRTVKLYILIGFIDILLVTIYAINLSV